MTRLPSTFAVDTGRKIGDRFFDVRWMSVGETAPPKRWYTVGEELPVGELLEWGWADVDSEGRLVAKYYREEVYGPVEDVLKLWFVLLDGRSALPAHFVLLAFADDRFPWGTVIEASEVSRTLSREYMASCVGMINWRAGDPMIQQISTSPNWRRRKIALTLFGVCDVINACYGFSPGKVLHGGAITTEDGEKLRAVYFGASGRIDPRIGSVTPVEES